MSEGLYIFVTLLALIVLDQYFKTGNRVILVVAGLLIGYATLIRYLGLAFMATAYLGVLVFSRQPWRQRGLDLAIRAGLPNPGQSRPGHSFDLSIVNSLSEHNLVLAIPQRPAFILAATPGLFWPVYPGDIRDLPVF
jgi:hypothetical protein